METWKPVHFETYKNMYEVSDKGRVRSKNRIIEYSDGRVFTYKEQILKPTEHDRGYLCVKLSNAGKNKREYVHRLVAISFLGDLSSEKEVNHIDGNKKNNVLENLEWVSSSENTIKGYELGLFEKSRKAASERVKNNPMFDRSRKIVVVDKQRNKKTIFNSGKSAGENYNRCRSYFSELIRKGGENKYFKAEFTD